MASIACAQHFRAFGQGPFCNVHFAFTTHIIRSGHGGGACFKAASHRLGSKGHVREKSIPSTFVFWVVCVSALRAGLSTLNCTPFSTTNSKQIDFGVFSTQDAKKLSVLELFQRDLYDVTLPNRPSVKFGVLDDRLVRVIVYDGRTGGESETLPARRAYCERQQHLASSGSESKSL